MPYPYAKSIVVHNKKKMFVKLYRTHYVTAKIAHKNKIQHIHAINKNIFVSFH